jgi:molecular chaperone DnaK
MIGIDLGTTFSAIAWMNPHGKPEIIASREGERTTPSVIFFEDNGLPIVGREARNQAIVAPGRTVRFVKREMGNPSYRFAVDGKEYFPEDLSALILKKLKGDAEAFLGQPVTAAVISVPAYFKDAQREATRQAGRIAGLEVTRIVNEPTAAALAYGLGRGDDTRTVLVYDFGGGTFDVTIMRMEGSAFRVLATDGDAKLGGKDIDARLVDHMAEEFHREHGMDLRITPQTHQDLWDKAEIGKRDLSFRTHVSAVLSDGGKTMRVDLDREFFERLIDDLIRQTESCMERCLADAGLAWTAIDTVLLAGGSSRIPAVRQMIQRVWGRDAAVDMNPDECVALGAAIQALVTASGDDSAQGGAPGATTSLVVTDVAAHSLGVKALSPDGSKAVNSILIPKLTPIPCVRTRTYTTLEDNQERVEIEVLQARTRTRDRRRSS